MKAPAPRLAPEAMKKLMIIGSKQGTISLKDLSLELGLGSEETLSFLRQIFPAGSGAEIYTQDNECMVDIDATALQYMLPLSPSEWMALHEMLSQQKGPALSSLKKKITENGPIKAVMELLSQLDSWDEELSVELQSFVKILDEAVEKKQLVSLSTSSKKSYQVFPCKIIHLEGKLSMIAEDAHDHCLVVLGLSEISSVCLVESTSVSKVSAFEVEEFIVAIRSMSEKETRLILKIHDPQSVNLFPDHHFLGKPCMISNPNGDLIWAAYVEPCDDLFDWLLSLGGNVEVLDPSKFKDEFLSYCEEKLRKVA
jgi:predicted DNA-binding transcriptional regulator YafY